MSGPRNGPARWTGKGLLIEPEGPIIALGAEVGLVVLHVRLPERPLRAVEQLDSPGLLGDVLAGAAEELAAFGRVNLLAGGLQHLVQVGVAHVTVVVGRLA